MNTILINPVVFSSIIFSLIGLNIYNELKILIVKRMYKKNTKVDAEILDNIHTYIGYRPYFVIAFCIISIGAAILYYLFPSDVSFMTGVKKSWSMMFYCLCCGFVVSGLSWRTLNRHISSIFYKVALAFAVVAFVVLNVSMIM
ncbi:hypothetical protein [Parabacteroides sp. PF5-9]|uniref:hypothetical protein n=1 Tax=Parabacteroides sp. PF5-9 TaxID=1742404 RepID=UPI00247340FA|nr:hypothetical protein [Parabacteroides sp. PF5-9]MDH6358957.1 phosphoglycerol transferase MdoB-like AlkP superfamily enzyme [Parabacteroides sp. PF5-9]